MPATSFWKTKVSTRIHTVMLTLVGLGACLLPALGSAQTLDVHAWQQIVKKAPPTEAGCFDASYPNMQ
jgi:hypothetical protein